MNEEIKLLMENKIKAIIKSNLVCSDLSNIELLCENLSNDILNLINDMDNKNE